MILLNSLAHFLVLIGDFDALSTCSAHSPPSYKGFFTNMLYIPLLFSRSEEGYNEWFVWFRGSH